MSDLDAQISAVQADRKKQEELVALGGASEFDSDLYTQDKFGGYENSIAVTEEEGDHDEREQNLAKCVFTLIRAIRPVHIRSSSLASLSETNAYACETVHRARYLGERTQDWSNLKLASYTAPKSIMEDIPRAEAQNDEDPTPRSATQAECVLCWALCMQMGFLKPARIIDREDDYRKRRLNRLISPARNDAMAMVRAQSSSSVSFPRWCGSMHPTLVQLRFPLAISCCAGERFFYSCKRGESGRTQSARVNHAG
eukprot:1181737-Prorocentrum_minimum.AAC.5